MPDFLRYPSNECASFTSVAVLSNPATSQSSAVRRLTVDTGAESTGAESTGTESTGTESTWIGAATLESIGIERRKKDLRFQLANGQIVTRSVGYAVLKVDKSETVDKVVFAEKGDLQLLGARALEGLNLKVDSRRKRLVAAGPVVAATAVAPRFGRLVQVSQHAPNVRTKTRTPRRRCSRPAKSPQSR